jgi:hypothetical protein
MYDHYSEVHDDTEPHFLTLRGIALRRKQPRKMFVQANMVVSGGEHKSYKLVVLLVNFSREIVLAHSLQCNRFVTYFENLEIWANSI